MKSIPAKASTMFCKTKEENSKRDSSFELQFTLGGKFYAYGFSAHLQDKKIKSEWLYELYQNGSAKTLFERENRGKPKMGLYTENAFVHRLCWCRDGDCISDPV